MARGEYLIRREGNAPPADAALPEARYRSLAMGAVLCVGGNQMRNGFAVPGNGHRLSVLHCTEEFGQTGLGFGRANLTHV